MWGQAIVLVFVAILSAGLRDLLHESKMRWNNRRRES